MKKFYLLTAFLLGLSLVVGAAENSSNETAVETEKSAISTPREKLNSTRQTAWRRRLEALKQQADKGGVEIVFIGDSITHFWENDAETDSRKFGGLATFKKYFSNYNVLNMGNAGDRTEHALWMITGSGLLDNINPKLVVVMIGTNNLSKPRIDTPEAIALGIEAVVKNIRIKLPEAKVLLFGIFPRSANANHHNRHKILTVNGIISKLADDKNIFYCDITDKLLKPDRNLSKEIMPDYLHPNDKGYEIWAEAIMPYVHKFVGEK